MFATPVELCFSSSCALGLGITNPWLPCSNYNESTTSYEILTYLLLCRNKDEMEKLCSWLYFLIL